MELPSVDELQNNPLTRPDWIQYSCYDSQGGLHRIGSRKIQIESLFPTSPDFALRYMATAFKAVKTTEGHGLAGR